MIDPISALLLMAGAIGAEGLINRKKKKKGHYEGRAIAQQKKTASYWSARRDIDKLKKRR